MSRLLTVIILVFLCCATLLGQAPGSRKATLSDVLLARSQQWVDTWNNRDVGGMRRLHADDVANQLYGIGEEFGTVDKLLDDIARENFWNLSWSIKIVESARACFRVKLGPGGFSPGWAGNQSQRRLAALFRRL